MSLIDRRMIHDNDCGQFLVMRDRLPCAGNEPSTIENSTAPAL